MTIRNLDAETAAAVKRHAAQAGRTLAEELRFLAGRAGISKTAENGQSAPKEKKLTGEEKLALARKIQAKQTKAWPCCVPLIRRVRDEWEAHMDAKIPAAPMRMTNADERRMRAARVRAIQAKQARRRK